MYKTRPVPQDFLSRLITTNEKNLHHSLPGALSAALQMG